MSIAARQVIRIEEVQRVLSEELGTAYQVSPTSDSTLKGTRITRITATLRLQWSGDRTLFRVSPDGLIVLKLINTLAIVPASFDVFYHDIPTGTQTCPTSAQVEITPPNDFLQLVIPAAVTACGGDLYRPSPYDA